MPFGLITNSTLFPTSSKYKQNKYTPLLHHEIIKTLHKEYWIPSRASRHSEAFPNPPKIDPPTMTKTPPINKIVLENKIRKFVHLGCTSLAKLITD